jgi:hypothetical protein
MGQREREMEATFVPNRIAFPGLCPLDRPPDSQTEGAAEETPRVSGVDDHRILLRHT